MVREVRRSQNLSNILSVKKNEQKKITSDNKIKIWLYSIRKINYEIKNNCHFKYLDLP